MLSLICPDGYYLFRIIPRILYRMRSWKIRALDFDISLLDPSFSSEHVDPVYEVMTHLATRLTSGQTESAAIVTRNGALVTVPPSAWRLTEWQDITLVSAIGLAFQGREILLPQPDDSFERATPVISGHELADAFDAENVPPLPFAKPQPLWVSESPGLPKNAMNRGPGDGPTSAQTYGAPDTSAPPPTATYSEKPSKLVGRPPRHDWEAFWIEVALYASANAVELEHRTELQRHMRDWCDTTWESAPDDATIRTRLKRLFDMQQAACN